MAKLMESGDLQRHIYKTLQPTYAQRQGYMMEAIERCLVPLGITVQQSNRKVMGGYFIWFSLPYPLRAEEVAAKAKEEQNLVIKEGSSFGVSGDSENQGLGGKIRVSFSWEEESVLVEGIERLGQVIRNMQQSSEESSDRDAFIFVSSMGGY